MFDTNEPFAILEKEGVITAYRGALHQLDSIADIERIARQTGREVVFVLPYAAIRERGFEAHGEEAILALSVTETRITTADELPDLPIALSGAITPSVDDDAYAAMIAAFQSDAIAGGHCAQATISRYFSGRIADFTPDTALALYKKLLRQPGHYRTVLFKGAESFIIAGTPERHIEITRDHVLMNPIAGTYRKADGGNLRAFLHDEKEVNELFQVVDEELKMMAVICPDGGTINGPYLREVGAVIHTEYELTGKRGLRAMDALRHSLHAPTVAGSPLESAARQIARFEGASRRYYAGEIGIYRPQDDTLDAAILIRGAEIFMDGTFRVQAGGGIVRNSVPENEARESRAKANGMLNVLTGAATATRMLDDTLRRELTPILQARNVQLSSFWMAEQNGVQSVQNAGKRITIVNNEDDFAFMLAHLLRHIGCADVRVVDTFAFDASSDTADIVLLGPGPGDPTDMGHPRMKRLQDIIAALRGRKTPMLGICLGHQALAVSMDIPVLRQDETSQGLPRRVKVNGVPSILAFYNSFSPVYEREMDGLQCDTDENGRIIAMHGDGFVGYQFHPESVMSIDGVRAMVCALDKLMKR